MAKAPETPRQAFNAGINAGRYVVANNSPKNVNYSSLKFSPSGDTSGSGAPSSPQNVIVNDGSTPEQRSIPQNTAQPEQTDQTLNVDEGGNKKDEKEMTVDELQELKDKTNDPAEKERLDTLINAKNPKAPVGGEITKTGNTDENQVEDDDKFDIQQGDFIDFLMKEVVLASAAWVGKKTFKTAGYWMLYKPLSYGYHAAEDYVVEKYENHKAKKDAEKKAQATREEIRRQYGEGSLTPNDVPSDFPRADDAKAVIDIHNKELRQAHSQIASTVAFSEYIEAFASGNLEERIEEKDGKQYWRSEKGVLLALDNPIVKKTTDDLNKAKELINQNPNLSDEDKSAAFDEIAQNTSTIMMEKYTLQARADLFAVNYATAKQLQNIADGTDPQDRKELLNEARTLYYTAHVAEHVGNKELTSTLQLSENAEEAKNSAFKQIKNQSSEKNSHLAKLDKLNSCNPSTGIFTEQRYNDSLISQLKHDTSIESLKNLDEQAKLYVQLKTNQIKEEDFTNNSGISSQDFANNHEKLAELINKQTERIDIVAPQGTNDQTRQELIAKLQGAVKQISETEKRAEIFALNYSFAKQTGEGEKSENDAILRAQGRQIYYAAEQKDKQKAQQLSENGRHAAQEARNCPNQENPYLQQILSQQTKNQKHSKNAKQNLIDAALLPYETNFEAKRQNAEKNVNALLSQQSLNDARRQELQKRKEAIRGTKTANKINPLLNRGTQR